MKVAIRSISLSSLGRHGCLVGAVAAAIPSLLCGMLGLAWMHLLKRWLSSWQDLTLTLFDKGVAQFNLVDLLGLEKLLDLLRVLTTVSLPVTVLAILALALVSGALLAVILIAAGLAYNVLASATGGLVVELKAIRPRDQSPGRG